MAQCTNLAIFLPLRFYVKSIIAIYILKIAILTILEAPKFEFGQFEPSNLAHIHRNLNSEPKKLSKDSFWGF